MLDPISAIFLGGLIGIAAGSSENKTAKSKDDDDRSDAGRTTYYSRLDAFDVSPRCSGCSGCKDCRY